VDSSDPIIQVVLDYVEGWYEGDAERMGNALSSDLVKRRVVSAQEIWDVSRDWMIEATGDGKGRLPDPASGRKDIVILDATETLATVKLSSNDFVDYLHLCKIDGFWKIVNVIWDYHSKA
jgi:hypothetical protein